MALAQQRGLCVSSHVVLASLPAISSEREGLGRHSSKQDSSISRDTLLNFFFTKQGSKLKKSSGRLLATNWRNIVARCKFLVARSYNVNDAAHSQGF